MTSGMEEQDKASFANMNSSGIETSGRSPSTGHKLIKVENQQFDPDQPGSFYDDELAARLKCSEVWSWLH
jgi:hypothetical protein